MARTLFGIEKGVRIFKENSDLFIDYIFDTGVPVGTTGDTDAASIGSQYVNDATGELYRKITDTSSAADWVLTGGGATLGDLSWRNETVIAATNDAVVAGVVDPTAWTDNESGLDGNDFTVGDYLIGDVDGVPALFEVTVVTGAASITVAAASQAIASNDTFVVQNFLPDSPAAQEGQAIIHVPTAGSPAVKIGDVNWDFATGINLSGGYTPASGDITSADSVESAIEKLDGNNDVQDQVLGTAQGATDLGTFAGDIITDNTDIVTALGELETELDKSKEVLFTGTIAQNTPTVIDTVLVDDFQWCEWRVVARDQGTRSAVKALNITALHQGHDASDVPGAGIDTSVSDKLKKGANFNLQVNVVLSGSGVTQTMGLQLETSDADGIYYTVERVKCLELAG